MNPQCGCKPQRAEAIGLISPLDEVNLSSSAHTTLQECSSLCRCRCQSRFQEKYLWVNRPPLAVMRVRADKWQLITLQSIPKGQFVLEFAGEVIEASDHCSRSEYVEPILTQSPRLFVRIKGLSSLARFLTHSFRPCLSVLRLGTGTDPRETRLLLFSCQSIEKDQKLTVNFEQLKE